MCYPLRNEVKVKLDGGEVGVDGRQVGEFLRQRGLIDSPTAVLMAIDNSLKGVEFLVTALADGGSSWVSIAHREELNA